MVNDKPFLPEEIAWAAGIFEGEGHFGKNSGRRTFQLGVTNKDLEVLQRFQGIVRCGVIYGPFGQSGFYRWQVNRVEAVDAVVEMFWPWLSTRRRKRYEELVSARVYTHPQRSTGRIPW